MITMDVINLRVPTKVTLFGEHAVVYGTPAIASTIPVYIGISGRIINDGVITINIKHGLQFQANNIVIDKGCIRVDIEPSHVKKILGYILTAINICEEELGVARGSYGYNITIDSPLPIGVGLGTSAAISVGIISLCLILNKYINDVENHRQEIARLAWNVEKTVQGNASPMDTYTIALGGLRYIVPSTLTAYSIDIGEELPVVIGYTHRKGTTADLVQKVKKIKELNERIFAEILNTIKNIVEEARRALINYDLETLGLLMNINHGILQSLGIVNTEHNLLIHTLRAAGALGAKTSGAGGGGAFIALAPSKSVQEKLILVAESLGAKVVSKSLCRDGVNIVH